MDSLRVAALAGLFFLLTSFGVAQHQICVGRVGGGDSPTWNIQQPTLQAINKEASSRGDKVTAQLMMAYNDKGAKGEMQAMKCDYGLVINTNREWPTPKGGGLKQEDANADEKNPHPASTAYLEFTLLDKNAKKIDKFKTQIEMKQGATAKDVQSELQEIIQELANWALDGMMAK
ncbi:hypothetical protein [Candidatus Korobacter versatilis]|uniref:hypothetical protein n=1 Tax=Candidatus Korobacter versatilis TaxID=658062 RepID=UPI0005A423E7|nr:hypothetical protein [Candidatus Koribacter versatilis]